MGTNNSKAVEVAHVGATWVYLKLNTQRSKDVEVTLVNTQNHETKKVTVDRAAEHCIVNGLSRNVKYRISIPGLLSTDGEVKTLQGEHLPESLGDIHDTNTLRRLKEEHCRILWTRKVNGLGHINVVLLSRKGHGKSVLLNTIESVLRQVYIQISLPSSNLIRETRAVTSFDMHHHEIRITDTFGEEEGEERYTDSFLINLALGRANNIEVNSPEHRKLEATVEKGPFDPQQSVHVFVIVQNYEDYKVKGKKLSPENERLMRKLLKYGINPVIAFTQCDRVAVADQGYAYAFDNDAAPTHDVAPDADTFYPLFGKLSANQLAENNELILELQIYRFLLRLMDKAEEWNKRRMYDSKSLSYLEYCAQ